MKSSGILSSPAKEPAALGLRSKVAKVRAAREGAGRAAVGEAFHDEGRGEARVGADGAGGGVASQADDLEADGLTGAVEGAVGVEGEEGTGLRLSWGIGVVPDCDGLALPGDGGGERVVVGGQAEVGEGGQTERVGGRPVRRAWA